jgi:hypothetical protein
VRDELPKTEIQYATNRVMCAGLAAFCTVAVLAFVAIAFLDPHHAFVKGLIPGWLFGPFGAVVFSVVGISWGRRALQQKPGLILSEDGVRGTKFVGEVLWTEVLAVYPGDHGSVVLVLDDPEAFRAGQRPLSRLLSMLPSPRRAGSLTLGGIDLETSGRDLLKAVLARWEPVRLAHHERHTLGSGEEGETP